MHYKRTLALLLAFIFSINLSAQEEGHYYVKNFHHHEYEGSSQSWAITQDNRGIIYIANNVGVIEYDGNEWRNISINNQHARCLDVDTEGHIWVGGQDEIGYLAADSTNNMAYYSLTHILPKELLPLGLVRQIYCRGCLTFFNTNGILVRINADLSVDFWKPKTYFHRSYYANNTLYINQKGYGLTYLKNDSLVRAKGCEQFTNKQIYTMLPYDNSHILIGTQSDGFYLYNYKCEDKQTSELQEPIVQSFTTSNDDFFMNNWVYSGAVVDSTTFVIGTYNGGVAYFNKKGQIIRLQNIENGLQNNAVWGLFADNQNGLWMALNNGISYTQRKSAISIWGGESGVNGEPQAVSRYNNDIYIATNTGIYKRNGYYFDKINGVTNLCWDLMPFENKEHKFLLIASSSGAYVLEGSNVQPVINGIGLHSMKLFQSKQYRNIIYVGLENGVGVIFYDNGTFKYIGKLRDSKGEVSSLVEDSMGDLWFTQRFSGINHIDIINPYQLVSEPPIQYQPPKKGKLDDITVSIIDNKIFFATESGLSSFDTKNKVFVADSILGPEFANGEKSLRVFGQDDSNGTIWFESFNLNPNRSLELARKSKDGYVRDETILKRIPLMIFNDIMNDSEGVVWIAATDGLFRVDEKVKAESSANLNTLIRNVIANKKAIYNGISTNDLSPLNWSKKRNAKTIKLGHSHNSLQFKYTVNALWQQSDLQYSTKLEGYDLEWNEWTSSQSKEYTNLPFGSYIFKVKARDIDGKEGTTASFQFIISKPWFLKWYSYIGYLICATLIALLLTKINNRRFKQLNERLQKLVEERTEEVLQSERRLMDQNAELEVQKEEILSQRDELEIRNKRINDSIQYAQTIQQAVLPSLNQMLGDIAEHFLLFLPRDMVSGDFYWASQIGPDKNPAQKVILAVVDCTGHGVPGAFMSLIGSRLLNEIVNERKVYNPGQILTDLAVSVKLALHQDETESFDGMDLAICSIEHKSDDLYIVTFAGANRPLYYINKNDSQVQIIKGSRKSIGSVLPDIDQNFSYIRIPMHRGDMLFMCTDGIIDQNNRMRNKFTSLRFQNVISQCHNLPIDKITSVIFQSFNNFRQDEPQRDDITVLGIRLK